MGHGAGYLYPHAYRDHWVAQQYLPSALQGRTFYEPSDQGYEATIRQQVARRREAQLAAMLEPRLDHHLAWSPNEGAGGPRAQNEWLQRTLGNVGQHLAQTRDRLFKLADLQRHDLVLDLNAGSGLLTWEAVRRAPEGGVWALAADEQTAAALQQQAANLDGLTSPIILTGNLSELGSLIQAQQQGQVRFNAMVGRNVLTQSADRAQALIDLCPCLAKNGQIVLAEIIPKHTQRLYKLVDPAQLPEAVSQALIEAEEGIYSQADDPMVNWDVAGLQAAYKAARLKHIHLVEDTQTSDVRISAAQIARWFTPDDENQRLTYIQHLEKTLSPEEIQQVKALFERQLANQVVEWQTRLVYISGRV
jgi:putative ATPase